MNECLNCGTLVKNKYCGVSCQNRHQKKKPSEKTYEKIKLTISSKWKTFNINCYQCNTEFEIKEYNVKLPKKQKYFCSVKCACTFSSNVNKENRIKKITVSNKKSKKVLFANKNKDWSKIKSNRWGHSNGGPSKIER